MKELERTKRISISAVLFLLVILIGFLTFKRPQYIFEKNTVSTLEKIVLKDYVISLSEFESLEASQYSLIDIRSNYEYEKGHFKGAVNISTHEVFNDRSMELLDQLDKEGKTIILYGEQPDKANNAWMLLYQMGYENAKVLCVETDFVDKIFHVKSVPLEKPSVNFAQVMDSAKTDQSVSIKKEKPKKKVITVQKKKKRVPEGGC
jgi:rhodanese-related sulfurtransferase